MSKQKELTDFLKLLQESGFEVSETRTNHYNVKFNGKRIATIPGSPSDRRWRKNALSDINRSMRSMVKDEP